MQGFLSCFRRLAQAQCSVGRTDAGRRRLSKLGARPVGERASVLASGEYQRAMCSQYDFGRAESSIDVVRSGGRAIQDFNAFIEVGDARRRVEQIRERMGQLRG